MTRTSHGYVRPVPTWDEIVDDLDMIDDVERVVAGLRELLPPGERSDELLDKVNAYGDVFTWARVGILDRIEAGGS